MKNIYLCVLAAFALFTSQATFAGMILSFESAERSWVGQGESHTVSLEDGYIFFVQQFDWDNSLEFYDDDEPGLTFSGNHRGNNALPEVIARLYPCSRASQSG